MAEEEERDTLTRHDTTPCAHTSQQIQRRGQVSECGNITCVDVCVCVCLSSYLCEGRYPLGQLRLHLGQRLGLPHGLLELLLRQLQPLLELPVLLLHLRRGNIRRRLSKSRGITVEISPLNMGRSPHMIHELTPRFVNICSKIESFLSWPTFHPSTKIYRKSDW